MPEPKDCTIQLAKWSELAVEQQAAVRGLSISDNQTEYAGSIDAAIAHCESNDEDALVGLAILIDAVAIGFLLLKRGHQAPEWVSKDAAIISALRIDVEHQGLGLGTEAAKLLPAWIATNWLGTNSLVLSVDEDNSPAIRSYSKAGWRDDGVRVRGRIGWERRMTLATRR